MSANRIAPDGTPRFAASHLGLFCFLMSHKKDVRRIWVKSDCSYLVKRLFACINHLLLHFSALNTAKGDNLK